MTDYKNLKLIATSNPHIRGSETTRSIMLDVIIAMCPALIWAIIYFGVEACSSPPCLWQAAYSLSGPTARS